MPLRQLADLAFVPLTSARVSTSFPSTAVNTALASAVAVQPQSSPLRYVLPICSRLGPSFEAAVSWIDDGRRARLLDNRHRLRL
jgi:hypothetical protein